MKEGFKKAYYRSIPAYFNLETNELQGRNKFYDLLISINLQFDTYIVGVENYPIEIVEEIES